MIKKWSMSYPAVNGTEQRRAYVYLPTMYEAQPERRFPVLYMFDGQNVFFNEDATYGKSWGMEQYLQKSSRKLMVVALESSRAPDYGRLKEYAPFSFTTEETGGIIGNGDITMDWIVHVLKRTVDTQYRTKADRRHTFLAGSSMGGLMTLYGLLVYPEVFSRGAALSPSLWIDAEKVKAMIRHARVKRNTVLYMDYGALEFADHPHSRSLFAEVSALLIEKRVLLNSRIVPRGTHCEASWEKQIPFFMKTLFE